MNSTGAVVDPSHRNLGLESDVANPNFDGARNPDDLLWVRFYTRSVHDAFNSAPERQNRPIFVDETWIEIRIPGNALSIIERPMEPSDKFRFPRQWAYFERTHSPDGQNAGTPLSQWPLLRPAQIEEMKALKFYSVEQIAGASDDQLKSMGMGPGMAPSALRERAKLFLETARDNAVAVRQADEIKRRDEEIAELKAKDAARDKEMAEMRAMIEAATKPQGKAQKA